MKIVLGLLLAIAIGVVCRLATIPLPAPPLLIGALLVLAMTLGYVVTDRFAAHMQAKTRHLCGGSETSLNEGAAGDPRDTTSPAAMAASLQALVLGDALSARSRAQLTRWPVENQTGGPLLRAGIPDNWRIGDRTGPAARARAASS